ncbi:hypothetical protein [Rubritalea marina]|uniref:hypothetical protein n=1 Tax=Rubritalea marina TaxID=361055 RepID=UPI00037E5C60|nr:hypothetical protein [Rubritalea marina]
MAAIKPVIAHNKAGIGTVPIGFCLGIDARSLTDDWHYNEAIDADKGIPGDIKQHVLPSP